MAIRELDAIIQGNQIYPDLASDLCKLSDAWAKDDQAEMGRIIRRVFDEVEQ
jgi:hypothetical protein